MFQVPVTSLAAASLRTPSHPMSTTAASPVQIPPSPRLALLMSAGTTEDDVVKRFAQTLYRSTHVSPGGS